MLIDILFGLALVYGIMTGGSGLFGRLTNGWKIILSIFFALRFSPSVENSLVSNGTVHGGHTELVALIVSIGLMFMIFTLITNNMSSITGQNFNIFSKGFGFLTYLFLVGMVFSAGIYHGEGTLIPTTVTNDSQVYPYIMDLWPIMQCKFQGLLPAFGSIIEGFTSFVDWIFGALGDECFPSYNSGTGVTVKN